MCLCAQNKSPPRILVFHASGALVTVKKQSSLINMASATVAQLDALYAKITEETNKRFDEGARNLTQMSAELQQAITSLRAEVKITEQTLRQESGLEMDRRIETAVGVFQKDSGAASFTNLMSDPRNKGIEHFSGCKAEDAKAFKVWRAKVYNYFERFIPGAEGVLTKYAFADTDVNDSISDLESDWNAKYTESVLKRELKIFLTEHLDVGAAEIVDRDREDGIEAWKTLNLFFEPKSQMTLRNLKSKIFDMNKESVKT